MRDFSNLLENLLLASGRNKKIKLISEFCCYKKDPDRGIVIGLLSGKFKIENARVASFRKVIDKRIDSYLFDFSYDYVGDFAETLSLIWPELKKKKSLQISEVVSTLENSKSGNLPIILEKYLDIFNSSERWALIKLVTRNFRIGVSSKLVRHALADYGKKNVEEIENIWNGINPPFIELFSWLEGKSQKPKIDFLEMYHSLMLANPIKYQEILKLNYNDYIAEWKWDGIRVQISINRNRIRIFSRTGDEINKSFPEIESYFQNNKKKLVLDGELLVGKNLKPFNFNKLQKRLNRKNPNKKFIDTFPSFIKAYDILFFQKFDLRKKSLEKRKKILKKFISFSNIKILDYSKELEFRDWENLKKIKKIGTNELGYEGLMIKLKKSIYKSGREKGFWYKWKRDPNFVDAILMYAKRGHGKRSSYYSDFTFGLFSRNKILPICKSYSGFTNDELIKIDNWVRKNIINRFGPIREVKKNLVFEIAFDEISKSNRHKSSISLRFPRINRIRWDKPVAETISLEEFKENFNIIE